MHCHLIISRKDQANKMKLSPLTNHKNTQKGTVTGGFDRVNLFQRVEQEFDKLFNYNRHQSKSFDYYNTIKNSFISDQLKNQNKQLSDQINITDTQIAMNTIVQIGILADKQKKTKEHKVRYKRENNISSIRAENQENRKEDKLSFSFCDLGLFNTASLLMPDSGNKDEQQLPVKRIKKKPKQGL